MPDKKGTRCGLGQPGEMMRRLNQWLYSWFGRMVVTGISRLLSPTSQKKFGSLCLLASSLWGKGRFGQGRGVMPETLPQS